MENGPINEKNVRESRRRLDHKVACEKLLSLVILLLNFAKPAVSLTFEQKLKFVMACIIRRWLTDYSDYNTSGVKRTILIAWSEDDINIVEYGNEFDKPILPVGSQLSDVIVDNSELKTELRNVFQGLNPWGYGNFGAVECEGKSTQQKKKGKDPCSGRPILIEGVLIRGSRLDSHQAGKENLSEARACKRVLQPSNNENSYTPKRARIQSMEMIQPRSYTAWLSLKSSSFSGFCPKFSVITGIPVIHAINRSPMDFLHQEDKCWSQIALALWNKGICTEPVPYRLKTGNCLHEFIYIQCEIIPLSLDTHHNEHLLEIRSTLLADNGEQIIKDSRRRLTQMLLDLLVSASQNSVPRSQQISVHQENNPPIATEAVYYHSNMTTAPVNILVNTYNNGDEVFHQKSSIVRPNYQMQEFVPIYSPRSDVFRNQNHSQENFINQPIQSPVQQSEHTQQYYTNAVTINSWSKNSSSPATALNDSGIGDDQCYDGLSNSDQCTTSSNFDETNAEFLWLQPLSTSTETYHLMSSRSAPVEESTQPAPAFLNSLIDENNESSRYS